MIFWHLIALVHMLRIRPAYRKLSKVKKIFCCCRRQCKDVSFHQLIQMASRDSVWYYDYSPDSTICYFFMVSIRSWDQIQSKVWYKVLVADSLLLRWNIYMIANLSNIVGPCVESQISIKHELTRQPILFLVCSAWVLVLYETGAGGRWRPMIGLH